MIPRLLVATTFVAAVAAQQTKVVPSGMDFVEGPSLYQQPFGFVTSGLQVLIDASQISQSTSVITSIRLRPTQITAAQTAVSFTKNYQIQLFTVPTTVASFASLSSPYDPNAVIAGATGTLVFNGPVTLPAMPAPLAVTPAPFSIDFPLTSPYVYTPSQGNLLIMLETADTTSVPGSYRIDAVQFRNDTVTGIAAAIDTAGCVVNSASLSASVPASQLVDGSSIRVQLTSVPATAFPAAVVVLGLQRADLDLGPLGLTGCTSRLGSLDFTEFAVATGGVFAPVTWAIPGDPVFRGLALVTQSLGLAASGQFQDSAVSNALALRIGSSTTPQPPIACSGFHTVTATTNGWFKGVGVQLTPVVQLEGIFP